MSVESKDFFKFKCRLGLQERGLDHQQKYLDRLDYEMRVILSVEFEVYFLVVADMVNWAKDQGIPCGPGRGSAAGSLVSYCLKITELDPIKYNLIFERFLTEARVRAGAGMCDIDLDFCEVRRHEVVEYLKVKYGEDCVAHIGTYGTMKARGAIREAARVLQQPLDISDKLANLVLPPIEGKPQPLSVCYEEVPELAAFRNQPDTPEQTILILAEQFEDLKRSAGTHAAGIVLSPEKISRIIPLYKGKDGNPTSQVEMNTLEKLGLIKFDILGLRTLTTIRTCTDLIKERSGEDLDISAIPLDDGPTFSMLNTGDTIGIFQFSGSGGIRDLLVQLQPKTLEDLSLLNATFRPGPLRSGLADQIIKVRRGEEIADYLIEDLKPILDVTAGVCIYQEQALEIFRKIAGFSAEESEGARRGIGKKKKEILDALKDQFIQGCINNGHREEAAQALFAQIQGLAAYQFNLSHSLLYSFISYQTAYLKTHYPTEFVCACLISDSDEHDKLSKYISYCQDVGIAVLPPDVNESGQTFSIPRDRVVRFGLQAIKGLGKGTVQAILKERARAGDFSSIEDFVIRTLFEIPSVNSKVVEALILAGALDRFGINRASSSAFIESMGEYRRLTTSYTNKLTTFHKRTQAWTEREREIEVYKDAKGAGAKGLKRPVPLKEPELPEIPARPPIPELPPLPLLEQFKTELHLLGCFITGHPLDLVDGTSPITLKTIQDGDCPFSTVTIPAVLLSIKEATSKNTKKKFAYLRIGDKTTSMEAVIFPAAYEQIGSSLEIGSPCDWTLRVKYITSDTTTISRVSIANMKLILSEDTPSITKIKSSYLVELLLEGQDKLHNYVKQLDPTRIEIKLVDGSTIHIQGNKQKQ